MDSWIILVEFNLDESMNWMMLEGSDNVGYLFVSGA